MFPGKESAWAVLGLESDSASARDVKRAYAALLKKHRPDADPEGFRRVHDAYQTALHELELRDHPDKTGSPGEPLLPRDAPEPRRREGPPLPLPFTAAAEKLRTLCASGLLEGAPEVLAQLRMVCGADPALWQEWSALVDELFTPELAPHLPIEDVLSELRSGQDAVAGKVLAAWHRARNFAAMTAAGRALTAPGAEQEYDHPACGRFALGLIFNLSMAQPGGANLLLDAAFRWLTPQWRAQLMPAVERRCEAGRLFWHVPAVWQPFWESVLDDLDAGRTPAWDSTDARRALQDLQRVTPTDWPGWGLLRANLPMRMWDDIVSYFNSRPPNRRSWTTPPQKQWLHIPGAELAAAPLQPAEETWTKQSGPPMEKTQPPAGNSRPQRTRPAQAAEDDLWNIPESPAPLPGPPPSRPIGEADTLPSKSTSSGQEQRRRRTVQEPYQRPRSPKHRDKAGQRVAGCLIAALIAMVLLLALVVYERIIKPAQPEHPPDRPPLQGR